MLGAVEVLAVNNFGDTRSGGLAGPMGLFIIVVLIVGTVLLIRNMNARLRRLPDSFPDPEADRREAEAARRDAEIAQLDADLRLPDAAVDRPAADRPVADRPPADSAVADRPVADPSRPAGSQRPGVEPARPDVAGPHGSPGESTDRP
jgi:hypothetical protein